jgi:hypothetical protein
MKASFHKLVLRANVYPALTNEDNLESLSTFPFIEQEMLEKYWVSRALL